MIGWVDISGYQPLGMSVWMNVEDGRVVELWDEWLWDD